MHRYLPAAAVLMLSYAGPIAAQSGPDNATIARVVDSLASVAVSEGLAPALGIAVVRRGRTIYSKCHGMADASERVRADGRTLWYLASTSKSFTGFGVSLLADGGALRLDAPIRTLLPAARWHADASAEQLTLAHFLSHTHHLNDNAVVMSAAFTAAIPEHRWPELVGLAVPSGNQDLVYSNFGYNVAAMVIDVLRPEGWKKFLEQSVFIPANMRETYARVSELDPRRIALPHRLQADGHYASERFEKVDATMNSAGGHLATLDDLARWTTIQMDSGRIEGRQVFPQSAVELSHRLIARQTRDQAKSFAYFAREGWSAGWDIGTYEGERMVSRFGSYHSTRSHLSFLPARRIGVVAMSTGGLGSSLTDLIASFVYDFEQGRSDARDRAAQRLTDLRSRLVTARRNVKTSDSTRAARQQPLGRPLSDFAGRYADSAYGNVELSMRNGRLEYRWGALFGPVEVFDAARNQLRIQFAGNGTVLSFDFPGQGPARSLQLQGVTFSRTP